MTCVIRMQLEMSIGWLKLSPSTMWVSEEGRFLSGLLNFLPKVNVDDWWGDTVYGLIDSEFESDMNDGWEDFDNILIEFLIKIEVINEGVKFIGQLNKLVTKITDVLVTKIISLHELMFLSQGALFLGGILVIGLLSY